MGSALIPVLKGFCKAALVGLAAAMGHPRWQVEAESCGVAISCLLSYSGVLSPVVLSLT